MTSNSDSPIIVLASRFLTPFIQVFALYVIFHGHYSPGGGFQGGAMLAASVLLMRIAVGSKTSQLQFKRAWATPLASLGLFIFAGTGVLAMLYGGKFLDYAFLPIPGVEEAARRSLGILIIEVGVGLSVMATLISIFDNLIGDEKND